MNNSSRFLEQESMISKVFEVLQSENVTPENYYVILFLVSIYKDGFIGQEITSAEDTENDDIQPFLRLSEGEFEKKYGDIYISLKPILKSISWEGRISIVHALRIIDRNYLSENFPAIFDTLLNKISESKGRHAGTFFQPIEITRFIYSLFELPSDAKVYNPFAGLASFGVDLPATYYYYGQELNDKIWTMGSLRLMAYKRESNTKYICDDSILNWPNENEKYDLIVSNPPYGLMIDNKLSGLKNEINRAEDILFQMGIPSLTDEGILIAVLPHAFLYSRNHWHNIRKLLIETDILDTIVSLPGSLLSYTGIPLTIIVVNKRKKRPGKVRMIKADSFLQSKDTRKPILNDFALTDAIRSNIIDANVIRFIDKLHIKSLDYNLQIPRYFQKRIKPAKNEKIIKLRDILNRIEIDYSNETKYGKLVRYSNLRNDRFDFLLETSEIENDDIQKPYIGRINETCVLLARMSRSLKPTQFKFEGTPIYINHNILAFKVNESITTYSYLINELHAEYVQEQLNSYRMSSTMPIIHINDLLEIKIKIPTFEEQRAKISGILELYEKFHELQKERNFLAHGLSNKIYEINSALKHTLGKPLLNIGSSLRNIENALSKSNSDWMKIKLSRNYDLTVKDSFISVQENLKLIHSILNSFDSDFEPEKYNLTEIDFLSFIIGYVNGVKSSEKPNIFTTLDIHPDIELEFGNKITIIANEELLKIGLNEIVGNAKRHGFNDDSKKYKLEFRISLYISPITKIIPDNKRDLFDTFIRVEVANNGNPFPNNFSMEKLIRKNSFAGETGNTGQGGHVLNEVIKYLNNGRSTLELVTDSSNEFTTIYSFLIPLNR